jgi:putative flippase GtrA
MFTSSRFSFVTSYLVAYAVGILINLYLQPKSVFKVKSNSNKRKLLLTANLVTIGVGVSLSYLLDASSVEPFFAATITAMITVPIGFFLTKMTLLGKLKSND